MQYEHILVERSGDFATVTMNRPRRRNALSLAHMHELIDAFTEIGASEALGVVLAGNGPVFCAGHDFADVADAGLAQVRSLLQTCTELMTLLQQIPQPVVARVHGLATAAGCQLVASCDLAIASSAAQFATPGVNIGLFCSTPMVALSRNVSRKNAMEMLLTGEMVAADEARRIGLVNRVVAPEILEVETSKLAELIAGKPRATVKIGKEAIDPEDAETLEDLIVVAVNDGLRRVQEMVAEEMRKLTPPW